MSEPQQKPGRSRQDYGTPKPFIEAVVRRFGALAFDLAAGPDNAQAAAHYTETDDALAQNWTKLSGNLWLNPPFGQLEPWARKAKESTPRGDYRRRILVLSPASVGTEWFAEHVHGHALVLALRPRLTFEGCPDPYPKDLMLSVFGVSPGFDTWRWDMQPGALVAA